MRFQGQTLHFLGPLVRELGRYSLISTPLADPLLLVAVPPKAVVGPAVLFRGAFRPDAALAPSFTLAALLYWFLALAFFLLVGLGRRRGLVPAHSFFLVSDRAAMRCCGEAVIDASFSGARSRYGERLKDAVMLLAVPAMQYGAAAVQQST